MSKGFVKEDGATDTKVVSADGATVVSLVNADGSKIIKWSKNFSSPLLFAFKISSTVDGSNKKTTATYVISC